MMVGVCILAAIMLAASIATASSTSPQATGVALTHEQVLQIALREARRSRDPHPKRIEMATGSPAVAMSVMEPTIKSATGVGGGEAVDLVVMHGYFHIDASPPPGRRIAPGKVIELMIGAYSGSREARSLSDRVPVPLSELGPVTRLR
jgi:hypothetical protein